MTFAIVLHYKIMSSSCAVSYYKSVYLKTVASSSEEVRGVHIMLYVPLVVSFHFICHSSHLQ